MKILRLIAGVALFLLTGCYAGSQFVIEAPHLHQPVSMTSAIHDSSLRVVRGGEYDDLGHFAISFSGVSLGSPLDPHPRLDVSEEINNIVRKKGGNGITNLSITASNSPVTFTSMFLRGVAWVGVVVGAALLLDNSANKAPAVATIGISAAGVLLLPTVGEFVIEGTVVRTRGS